MKITRSMDSGSCVLAVEGWLDTPSSEDLQRAIEELGDVESLVLDFGGVEYICSAGLRAVLCGYRKMEELGGKFAVVRVRGEVMDVFRLTGLVEGLHIEAGEGKGCGQ